MTKRLLATLLGLAACGAVLGLSLGTLLIVSEAYRFALILWALALS